MIKNKNEIIDIVKGKKVYELRLLDNHIKIIFDDQSALKIQCRDVDVSLLQIGAKQ